MKRKTSLLILFQFLILSTLCVAETSRHKQIYQAYISGNINQWISVVKEMESGENIRTVSQKLELIEYYYGLSGFYIGQNNLKMVKITIDKADIILNKLMKEAPNTASVYSYKGSLTAFRIALNKYKAITLGAECLKYIDRGYQMDTSDIQAITDKANALQNAPRLFGGNKTEAIRLFQKSILLMEKTDRATDNWFYLNTLAQLAQAYVSINQPDKAKLTYEKALRKEPDFLWVKNKMYPDLLLLIKSQS
ncbi:MAG: tetratricopeptide repeat protein [Bacteroidales bacterium]|nr:tetratricopeptide repeat protein [Bacteroidales bacterium]